MSETGKPIATVTPWEATEGTWGVAVDYPDGRKSDYLVGTKAAALAECREINGGTPIFPTHGPDDWTL